jgi:hypothetical protein
VSDLGFVTRFAIAALATWRVTHLLAREDGPGDLLVGARTRLGGSLPGKLMDCFHCLSLWVAVPLCLFVGRTAHERAVVWLALSGAACLLERLGPEPVVMYRDGEVTEGGVTDGMLRSAASGAQEYAGPDDASGEHRVRS